MAATNPVGSWVLPNSTSDLATSWKFKLDAAAAVAQRIVDPFAPKPQASPNMTVAIDAGYIFADAALTEVAAQTSPTFVKPTANSRIDRIVIDRATGAISVVAGTQSASPVAPAIPTGKHPCAQVFMTSATTILTAANIYDERAIFGLGLSSAAYAPLAANINQDASGNLIDNMPYQNKTGSYSFVTGDRNKLTNFTIASAATLTVLASPGAGWKTRIAVADTSAGVLTVSGATFNGPGISGLTSFTLVAGQTCDITFDGSTYRVSALSLSTLNEAEATIASAATTNLGSLASNTTYVTGSVTITSFGSSATMQFPIFFVRFAGALTLTHNATSLILPGAANITTAAGDTLIAQYMGSGNWRVISYTKASGAGGNFVTSGAYTPTLASSGTWTHGLTTPPNRFLVWLQCTSAEGNYSVGDKVSGLWQFNGGVNTILNISASLDASGTSITYTVGNQAIALVNKTTGAFFSATIAKWSLYLEAYND